VARPRASPSPFRKAVVACTAAAGLFVASVSPSLADPAAALPQQPGADEIVRRSVEANEADWRAEPYYDYCERDDDGSSAKTYDVRMIEGTPYQRLVAIDDQPLPAAEQEAELRKLEREVAKRRSESPSERARRVDAYDKEHTRIRAIFEQLAQAFTFALKDRQRIGEKSAFVLAATPRADYRPPSRDARVLKGMDADFWIDADTFHWMKVMARVTRPVSIVGMLARVEQGTTVELEKAPVHGDVWLRTHLEIKSSSRILLLVPHHTYEDERYFQYRPSPGSAPSTCRERP
jgi:hypothetical protein